MARRNSKDSKDSKLQALIDHGTANPHPELVRDEAFKQSEFFDARDLLQVKYEMLRQVRVDGEPIANTADRFGVSRPTFYKAQTDFDRDGLAGLLPVKRGPRGPHKVTDDVMDLIQLAIDEHKDIDSAKLAQRVERELGLRVHRRTIERALLRSKKKAPGGNP